MVTETNGNFAELAAFLRCNGSISPTFRNAQKGQETKVKKKTLAEKPGDGILRGKKRQ